MVVVYLLKCWLKPNKEQFKQCARPVAVEAALPRKKKQDRPSFLAISPKQHIYNSQRQIPPAQEATKT